MTRLAFGAKCGSPGETTRRASGDSVCALRQEVELQQFREGSRADAEAGLAKKTAPGQIQRNLEALIHGYSFITVSCRLRIRLVTLV